MLGDESFSAIIVDEPCDTCGIKPSLSVGEYWVHCYESGDICRCSLCCNFLLKKRKVDSWLGKPCVSVSLENWRSWNVLRKDSTTELEDLMYDWAGHSGYAKYL